jgi:Zn-dependent protease
MLTSSLKLGRIAGVEIALNVSLVFMAGLLFFSLGLPNGYFGQRFPQASEVVLAFFGLLTTVLFFIAILWHELAHALMAQAYGIPVRRIVLFIFGGMAEIEREPSKAYQEFWVALVGPLSSLVFAVLSASLGLALGLDSPWGAMGVWLAQVNVILALFNLIPAFPLDGGRILRALLWAIQRDYLKATRWAASGGQVFALLFMGLGLLQVLGGAGLFSAFWTLFIAWFLWTSARGNFQVAKLQHALRNVPLRHAIPKRAILNPDWSLAYALDMMAMGGTPMRSALVMREGELMGLFRPEQVARVPRLNWGILRVAHLVLPLQRALHVDANADFFDVLRQMELEDLEYVVVQDDLGFLGVIGRLDLLRIADQHRA